MDLREEKLKQAQQQGWMASQKVQMVIVVSDRVSSKGQKMTSKQLNSEFGSRVKLANPEEPFQLDLLIQLSW